MERFVVSARKYRPNNFSSLVGQGGIATTLKNSIKRGQLAHAYLFCGPRGVGKTSTARIFAKTINCFNPGENFEPCGECESCKSFMEGRSYCIHELDAASNNSVDDIRSLTEKVNIPPQIGKYSVYIIDEVHMLSSSAFNAFLKTLEEPPAHAIFILATTEKHKILPTILSRCQTYDFNRISIEDIVLNLKDIAGKEGITIDSDSLHVIAQKADGAMRDALTLFDQTVAFCGTDITYSMVIKNLNVLDYDYYFRMVNSVVSGNYTKGLLLFDEILSKGFNALYFVTGLSNHFRNLLIAKEEAALNLMEVSDSVLEKYKEQTKSCSVPFLYQALNFSTKCEADYKNSYNQRLLVEFMLFKLSALAKPEIVKEQSVATVSSTQLASSSTAAPVTTPAAPLKGKTESLPTESKTEYKKGGGLSIKSILNSVNNLENKVEEVKEEIDKEITEESLIEAWNKLADSQDKLPRLASAIRGTKPILKEDKVTIIFTVNNLSQKSWIEKNLLVKLNNKLQQELSNKKATLLIEVAQIEEKQNLLYTSKQKSDYLMKNNPELRTLSSDLKLEIE